MNPRANTLVLIVGPTAVGKTDLAIQLAQRLNGEIVSADSRLFYRGMDIGTAKPTLAERAVVPHHLIDIAYPDQTLSLAEFQSLAHGAIADVHARGRLPFLVGGSGQYLRAVTEGWQPPEVEPNETLRSRLETMQRSKNPNWLRAAVEYLDPAAGRAIDGPNSRRLIRALEVIYSTGRKFSAQRKRGESPYRLITIGLTRPRDELYARIDARIEAMFANGFVDEVRKLLDLGYSPSLPSMSAIGYRECISVVKGESSEAIAQVQIARATRVFVRRQSNWFKQSDARIRWFNPQEAEAIEHYIRSAP